MESFLEKSCDFQHKINKIKFKSYIQIAMPFTTSILQQKASNELHCSQNKQ